MKPISFLSECLIWIVLDQLNHYFVLETRFAYKNMQSFCLNHFLMLRHADGWKHDQYKPLDVGSNGNRSGFASVQSSKFNISMQTPSLFISHSNIYIKSLLASCVYPIDQVLRQKKELHIEHISLTQYNTISRLKLMKFAEESVF